MFFQPAPASFASSPVTTYPPMTGGFPGMEPYVTSTGSNLPVTDWRFLRLILNVLLLCGYSYSDYIVWLDMAYFIAAFLAPKIACSRVVVRLAMPLMRPISQTSRLLCPYFSVFAIRGLFVV